MTQSSGAAESGTRPGRALLAGSVRASPVVSTPAGPLPADEPVDAVLVLRRRAEPPAAAFGGVLTSDELAERYGADPAEVRMVAEAVTAAGAAVVAVDPAARLIRISAPAAVMNELFDITLQRAAVPGAPGTARHQDREVSLPAHLAGIVTGVLGLDTRPQARPKLRVAPAAGATPTVAAPLIGQISYTPPQLGTIYRMPAGTDGAGRVIAIIELGGGFSATDLRTYFAGLGIPVPDVRAHGVDGAVNAPTGTPDGPDGEVMLDIEVAGALAPAAVIDVYFAPNTDAGFLDALVAAGRSDPVPAAISISWGSSEDAWAATSRVAMDQAIADVSLLGACVTVAAGDSGSSDGAPGGTVHVDFPASSPHALACGGTSLHADPSTGDVASETVWNDGPTGGATGGGVSDVFPLPPWQAAAGVPPRGGQTAGPPTGAAPGPAFGRGVPDVAAVADPRTGYAVLVDGQSMVFGGTSAVAPLWAALLCRVAQTLGRPIGLAQPALYAGVSPGTAAPAFRDVTSGDNGAYRAGPGWDACTGLGSPIGVELAARFAAAH